MSTEKIKKNIEEHGWHFLFVFDPNGEHVDFAYSIGFEESYGHPEIIVFGLKKDTAHAILSDIAEHLKAGKMFEPEKKISGVIGGDYEVIFKTVINSGLSDYLGTALDFYGKPFRAWVLFWPDNSNVLPIDSGCGVTVQNEALGIV